MNVSTLFKKALEIMLERGYFDKIINYDGFSAEERKRAEHDKTLVKKHYDYFYKDMTKTSFINILYDLKSVAVLKDALCLMCDIETGVNTNE